MDEEEFDDELPIDYIEEDVLVPWLAEDVVFDDIDFDEDTIQDWND